MKNIAIKFIAAVVVLLSAVPASAQFNIGKIANAAKKGVQAFTLTDDQMAAYVKESVDWMDKNNKVPGEDDPYTIRLRKLTENLKEADGIPLNFKVYDVIDINAFACPDGSVRVFSSLMDIMSDEELLGIIGHEIGHVARRHSKNGFKQQLLTGAMKDAIASTGGKAAQLTESQLGTLGENLIGAKYSQKQENEADDSGYESLVKNGINPWGMVMAFEKFQNLEGGKKSGMMEKMFSSHPETAKRIQRMSERATKDGYTRPEENK